MTKKKAARAKTKKIARSPRKVAPRMPACDCHALRFRSVSNRYPRRVADAYDGDVRRAMTESDEQVAAAVAAWERRQGLTPRDWQRIGHEDESRSVAEDRAVHARLRKSTVRD
jgi:hypothetical protein